jgi:hypothetical protein
MMIPRITVRVFPLTQLKVSGTKKVNTATAITVNEAFAASHLLIF